MDTSRARRAAASRERRHVSGRGRAVSRRDRRNTEHRARGAVATRAAGTRQAGSTRAAKRRPARSAIAAIASRQHAARTDVQLRRHGRCHVASLEDHVARCAAATHPVGGGGFLGRGRVCWPPCDAGIRASTGEHTLCQAINIAVARACQLECQCMPAGSVAESAGSEPGLQTQSRRDSVCDRVLSANSNCRVCQWQWQWHASTTTHRRRAPTPPSRAPPRCQWCHWHCHWHC